MIDFHPTDSPKYLGLLHGIFSIGSLLAPVLMQVLLRTFSWRGVHFVVATVVLLAMIIFAVAGQGTKRIGSIQATQEERLSGRQIIRYLRNRRNLVLLGCGAMVSMLQTGLICWIARYMLLAHGDAVLGSTCLTIYWVMSTINRFLTPRLRVRPLVLILGGAACSIVLLAVGIISNSAMVMCVCFGLLGLTTGHFMPMMISESAKGYQGNTTLTTSVLMFVMGIARVIVPLAMAALTDAVSVRLGMSFPIFAGIAAVLLAVGALRLPAPAEKQMR